MIVPPWVYAAAGALALSVSFGAGWAVNGWRWEARQAEALKQQQAAFQRQLERQNKEADAYEQQRETARVEYRDREGAIRTIFRDVEVPADCAAPDAVRGVLNEAIRSANADTGQPGAAVPEPR